MICMRISKNGKVWVVMGHKTVDVLALYLLYVPGESEASVLAFGPQQRPNQPDRPVRWLGRDSRISTTDSISIDFVETDHPDPFADMSSDDSKPNRAPPGDKEIRCSFCGRDKLNVGRVVAGPGVFICDTCIALCNQVLQENTDGRT